MPWSATSQRSGAASAVLDVTAWWERVGMVVFVFGFVFVIVVIVRALVAGAASTLAGCMTRSAGGDGEVRVRIPPGRRCRTLAVRGVSGNVAGFLAGALSWLPAQYLECTLDTSDLR